jgi:hypothetical protein
VLGSRKAIEQSSIRLSIIGRPPIKSIGGALLDQFGRICVNYDSINPQHIKVESYWMQRNDAVPQTDRSFRNYSPGNVAHDRHPQTVALIKLLAAGTATPPVLANVRLTQMGVMDGFGEFEE